MPIGIRPQGKATTIFGPSIDFSILAGVSMSTEKPSTHFDAFASCNYPIHPHYNKCISPPPQLAYGPPPNPLANKGHKE